MTHILGGVAALIALGAIIPLSHGVLVTGILLYVGLVAAVGFYMQAQKQTPNEGPPPRIDPWD